MMDANQTTDGSAEWLTGYRTGSVMDLACRRFAEVKERKPNCDDFTDLTWVNGYAKCLLDTKQGNSPDVTSDRDMAWILAIGHALGLDSGYMVPIVPTVEQFKLLFEEVRKRVTHEPSAMQLSSADRLMPLFFATMKDVKQHLDAGRHIGPNSVVHDSINSILDAAQMVSYSPTKEEKQ
jgi:hypothetical protein